MTDTRTSPSRRPFVPGSPADHVDLPGLAIRLLGPPGEFRGHPAWPCPLPDHPATDAGRTSLLVGLHDRRRWSCATCHGFGGAVELVMHTQGRSWEEALRIVDTLVDELPPSPARSQPVGLRNRVPARPAPAQRMDVDTLLAQIDLDELIVRILGEGKRRGSRGRSWPCPAPGHGSQTGRTPPVTLFVGRDGRQRWHCHSCGAGGTAIDLIMTAHQRDVGEAIRYLRELADTAPAAPRPTPPPPPAPPPASPAPGLARWVRRCEQRLWSPLGMPGRNYLERRGLAEPVLRANRVGYDPGTALLPRDRGLPRGGPAVVLPALDRDGQPVYAQARYLTPKGDHRYDNPSEQLAGPSPRVAILRTPDPAAAALGITLLCEGLLDGLSAAQAGYPAAAVLGAGYPDQRVARTLLDRLPDSHQLLLAFDDDARGRDGSRHLTRLLTAEGAGHRVLELQPRHGDLNRWLQAAGAEFGAELAHEVAAIAGSTPAAAAVETSRPPPLAADDDDRAVCRVRVLQPCGSGCGGYHDVHIFSLPAALVREQDERHGEPPDLAVTAAERTLSLAFTAAELTIGLSQTEPEHLLSAFAPLAEAYRADASRSLCVGDVVQVEGPNGHRTVLQCAGVGWKELPALPASTPCPEPPSALPWLEL